MSVLFYLYFSGKRHVTFWCLISWWALVVLEACSCNAVFGPELRVRTNAGLKYASRLKCFIDKDANNWRRNVTPRDMIAEYCRNNRTVVAMATVQHLHYNTQSIEAKTNNESLVAVSRDRRDIQVGIETAIIPSDSEGSSSAMATNCVHPGIIACDLRCRRRLSVLTDDCSTGKHCS